ncbi:MAG: hypothetical protein ACK59M_16685 [Pseudomonadota bacterium]|jgi:hypothetical protein
MSDDGSGILALLAAGPASAVGLYWLLYRHYRNTDKSHAFERETDVDAKPVTGTDRKVSEIKGTRKSGIDGDNVRAYRARVRRVPGDGGRPP